MKIVYCLNSIRYLGGIQRVTIVKANALAEIEGNEVYVVVTDNKEGKIVHQLSPKVHLIDLDINYFYRDTERSRILNYMVVAYKNKKHYSALKRFLTDIKPDVVISVGTSEKYLLPAMKQRSWKIIREFHHVRNKYRSKNAKGALESILAPFLDYYDFHIKEKQYDKIVVLTQEDKDTNWSGFDNVSVLPNPVSFESDADSSLNNKVVVTFGRLDPMKNFSSLIRAFQLVSQKYPDWKLRIYGDGSQKVDLHNCIEELSLQNIVFLMGFTDNVKEALYQSSIMSLSSLTEGFSLVLVEAMECGVPVVSYQCPCGPKDIITDGVDGFLVPVNDERAMADRICQLIEDEELRHKMGAAAKETAKKYHIENIIKEWMQLFNELINTESTK